MSQVTEQAQIVAQAELNPGQVATQLALFDLEGNPVGVGASSVLTGYEVGDIDDVEETDTVAEAIGKLEARIVALENPS